MSAPAYVNTSVDVVDARLAGEYDLGGGLGAKTFTTDTMRFYNNGFVNMPRHGHAIWFMSQYYRLDLMKEMPNATAIANKLIMADLYAEVAKEMGIALPSFINNR